MTPEQIENLKYRFGRRNKSELLGGASVEQELLVEAVVQLAQINLAIRHLAHTNEGEDSSCEMCQAVIARRLAEFEKSRSDYSEAAKSGKLCPECEITHDVSAHATVR